MKGEDEAVMEKLKILETLLKAVTALLAAAMSVIKFIGYASKLKPEPA